MFFRKQGAQHRVALVGVTLAALALTSAFFARQISRGLRPAPPVPAASVPMASVPHPTPARRSAPARDARPATPSPSRPVPSPDAPAPEMTVQVQGDGNTINLRPSDFTPQKPDFQLDGDGGTSDFLVGPRQTARVELTGDGNSVHVAASLQDRVTIVDKGDGNSVAN